MALACTKPAQEAPCGNAEMHPISAGKLHPGNDVDKLERSYPMPLS
jgi:hypothetical protein